MRELDNRPLWEHQKRAVREASMLPGYALFFEMGSGKSRTVIEILRFKFNAAGRVLKTIIFCPPLVIPNFCEEWLKFSSIQEHLVIPLYGSGKKRLDTFLRATDDPDKGLIFITNYETLLMDDIFEAFCKWSPDALVFDESHKCKSTTAKRSKRADLLANPWNKLTKKAKPKPLTYILSGSPILNSPMDIFQQFKIMDGGRAFGSNYWAFRARYFRDRNAGMPKERYFPKWEIMTPEKDGVDALGSINRLIFTSGMRVEKKDCLDLPPEVSVVIKCAMTPTQTRLYSEMKKGFITFLDSKACTATLAITKALRMMQITSGFVSLETEGEGENVLQDLEETPKYEALKGLIEEIIEQEQKVLIWAVFKHNYATIRRACDEVRTKLKQDFTYVEVHGEVTDGEKRKNVETFKADPNCRIFIGHPGSGGIGINLTCAAFSIFYSRTFSLEHYLQARARNHRGGSKEAGHDKITHYDLVCEETIDELALKKLANKIDVGDKILTDIRQELEAQRF